MTMPGFAATASLGPAIGRYGGMVASGESARSARITGALMNFDWGGRWPPVLVNECCLRSCGMFGCFKSCAQCRPGEGCRCKETSFGPFCYCEPQVLAPV